MSSRAVLVGVLVSLITGCASVRVQTSLAEKRRQQFEERRAAGRGVFYTREEIKNAQTSTLVTLLRRVPSVRVVCQAAGCVVKMSRATGDCTPALLIDGYSAPFSTDLSMSSADISGIEVYRAASETPLEFLGAESSCGTIVIWTGS